MTLYNDILTFYISVCCLMRFLLLIFYIITNGEYIIIIRRYFGLDKYSFYIIYIILLRIWIINLIYISLLFDEKDELVLKIIIFNIVFNNFSYIF